MSELESSECTDLLKKENESLGYFSSGFKSCQKTSTAALKESLISFSHKISIAEKQLQFLILWFAGSSLSKSLLKVVMLKLRED